jgi:hypothetical protein
VISNSKTSRKFLENNSIYEQKGRSKVMKLKTLLIIKAAVCLCLGLPILFAPDFIYSIFGATLAAGGTFAAREYAASMIGNLMLTWFARNSQVSDAKWAMILALCVYDAVGFLVTLIAIFTGAINSLGWLIVLIYLFFAAGFGYFLISYKTSVAEVK